MRSMRYWQSNSVPTTMPDTTNSGRTSVIAITGGTEEQQELVKLAAADFLYQLFPRKHWRIVLDISLKPDLFEKQHIKGDCGMLDSKNEYEITLDADMHHSALLHSLAHECVHVQQYSSGRLRDTRGGSAIWLGKLVKIKNYWRMPWEVEAYGLERYLVETFTEKNNLTNAPWRVDYDYYR